MAFITLATRAGRKLQDKAFRTRRDPAGLERYYSPAEEIELVCSEEEREDFERESEKELGSADVLTAEEFEALKTYLTQTYYGLKIW